MTRNEPHGDRPSETLADDGDTLHSGRVADRQGVVDQAVERVVSVDPAAQVGPPALDGRRRAPESGSRQVWWMPSAPGIRSTAVAAAAPPVSRKLTESPLESRTSVIG